MDRREVLQVLVRSKEFHWLNNSLRKRKEINVSLDRNGVRGNGYLWRNTHSNLRRTFKMKATSREEDPIFTYPIRGGEEGIDGTSYSGCHSRADMHGRILKDLIL